MGTERELNTIKVLLTITFLPLSSLKNSSSYVFSSSKMDFAQFLVIKIFNCLLNSCSTFFWFYIW